MLYNEIIEKVRAIKFLNLNINTDPPHSCRKYVNIIPNVPVNRIKMEYTEQVFQPLTYI